MEARNISAAIETSLCEREFMANGANVREAAETCPTEKAYQNQLLSFT
jgi:hypothetical protein